MLDRILNNLVTSMAGVVAGIVAISAVFGLDIDPKLVTAALSLVVFILGLFAKD